MDVPRAAEPLLALPPARFTAERDALARDLAARGDPASSSVRKVRRPVGLAWVLNRLARERPSDLQALFSAGDRLRAGQRRAISGAGADQLRAADEELRARARALRSAAERSLAAEGRPLAAPALARLELLLRVTAPLPGPVRDALGRGVLLREPEIAPGEITGFSVLPGGRAPPHAPPGRTAGAEPRPARANPGEAGARRDEAREAGVRAERERRAHERLAARARRDAKAASERAARAERAAAAAAETANRAAERAKQARAEADRLAATLRTLEGGR